MIVSRASRAALLPLAALAAALALPAPPVAAQAAQEAPVGAPVQLGPRELRPDGDEAAPPPTDAAPPAMLPSAPPTLGRPGPVEVQTLGTIDPDSVGTMDQSEGGFPIDLWQGLDRMQVAKLLDMLPQRMMSPTMRDLARRLLLSRVAAPQGERTGGSLLARRVGLLFSMGDTESALSLLRSAPPGYTEDELSRAEVEGYFLLNDNAGACRQVRGQVQNPSTYWQQASAYCLALAGQPDKATLVADILAERADAVPAAFFAAMDTFAGFKNAKVESLPDPAALHISMMRAANLQMPADVLDAASPALMGAVAASPNAPFEVRLEAAEQALRSGALSPETLREIYASVPIEESASNTPLSFAEENWGPKARALLVRAAAAQNVDTGKAEMLQRGYRLGLEHGGYRPFLMASLPQLVAMAPAGELLWFARDAGRALFAAGRLDEAKRWYDFVKREVATNADAKAAVEAIWPLAHLAGVAGDENPAAARVDWWNARVKAKDPATPGRAQKLFALLESLGETVDAGLWRATLTGAGPVTVNAPRPGLRYSLTAASQAGRLGEGVALALAMLGPEGPAAADTIAVEEATRALMRLHLEKEARAIALEAAVAGGF